MHHLLKPRSRLFRSLSILALLAWTAFAFDAFAHPLAIPSISAGMASMTAGNVTSHCEGMAATNMPHALHPPAPSHPDGDGHGCCHHGVCPCASLCSGVVGVRHPDVVLLQPLHDRAVSLIHSGWVLVGSAPLLRPPIA